MMMLMDIVINKRISDTMIHSLMFSNECANMKKLNIHVNVSRFVSLQAQNCMLGNVCENQLILNYTHVSSTCARHPASKMTWLVARSRAKRIGETLHAALSRDKGHAHSAENYITHACLKGLSVSLMLLAHHTSREADAGLV